MVPSSLVMGIVTTLERHVFSVFLFGMIHRSSYKQAKKKHIIHHKVKTIRTGQLNRQFPNFGK